MRISKERFDGLGLGCDRENCISAHDCDYKFKRYEVVTCVDDERLREDMTDEEYDAYRHNRLEVAV